MRARVPLARRASWAAAVLVPLAAGCAQGPGRPPRAAPPQGWQTTLRAGHPLVGRIWDVRARRFVGADELVAALVPARYVLLGEKHDNPDDHALQRWVLAQLVDAGRKPAVVFEQLDRDQQGILDAWVAEHGPTAVGLGEALAWEKSGWPSWSYYEPIFQLALARGLPVLAGNLSKGDLERLRKGELEGLSPEDRRRFGLDLEPTPAQRASLVAELKASHCGFGNDAMFSRMVVIQWARDAQLASRLVEGAARADGAVLIAGAGHVRDDRGVPFHLAQLDPGATARSVVFLEVVEGLDGPGQYADEGEPRLPFDYVWFTPRVDEKDPCAQFHPPVSKP